jgi:hypothetical protein
MASFCFRSYTAVIGRTSRDGQGPIPSEGDWLNVKRCYNTLMR